MRKHIAVFVVSSGLVACGAILGSPDDGIAPPVRTNDGGDANADGDPSGGDATANGDAGDGGEGTDGGDPNDGGAKDAAKDAAKPLKYVFITSELFGGAFGSRALADAECGRLAKAANNGRWGSSTFKAYLAAGNGGAPQTRIVDQDYFRVGDDQKVFAKGWTAVADPQPIALVAFDEKGQSLLTVMSKQVWTGLATGIAAADRTCGDWMTGAGAFGGFGDIQSLASWDENTGQTAACASTYRLYCFED